jgi:hypothetical protein
MGAQAGQLPAAPYPDLAAATVLRAALPGSTVETTWSADYGSNLPYIAVWSTGTGTTLDPRGRYQASVDIDSFAADKPTAMAQCSAALTALAQAAFDGDPGSAAGRISDVTVTTPPRVIPGTTPSTIIRAQATVSLRLRPATP